MMIYRSQEQCIVRTKWKVSQDALCRVKLGKTQEKGLQLRQTMSHAIIRNDPVPADRIEKVVSLQGDKILHQRIPTPRPALKIVPKDAWQVEEGKLSRRERERSLAERRLFKIDFRFQKVPQNAVNNPNSRIGENSLKKYTKQNLSLPT